VSGARNTRICPGRNLTEFWGDSSSVNVNNTILLRSDSRCR
jgi:hypothetical protein